MQDEAVGGCDVKIEQRILKKTIHLSASSLQLLSLFVSPCLSSPLPLCPRLV